MGLYRNTKQSALILNIINESSDHLTASMIYEKARCIIPNISLGTVYRNLNSLYDANKIRKVISVDEEVHYDNVLVTHNHFICLKCHKIIDVWERPNIKTDNSFGVVTDYEIYYKGQCNECLGKR